MPNAQCSVRICSMLCATVADIGGARTGARVARVQSACRDRGCHHRAAGQNTASKENVMSLVTHPLRRIVLILVTLALTTAAAAQTLPAGVKTGPSMAGITEYSFPN